MSTFQVRSGDLVTVGPSLLTNRDGTGADITGGSVRLQWSDWDGNLVGDVVATIVAPTPASVSYTLLAADTVRTGIFRARWKVTYAGGGIETFPTAPDDLLLEVY